MSEVRPIPKALGRQDIQALTDAELVERFRLLRITDPFLQEVVRRLAERIELDKHEEWTPIDEAALRMAVDKSTGTKL